MYKGKTEVFLNKLSDNHPVLAVVLMCGIFFLGGIVHALSKIEVSDVLNILFGKEDKINGNCKEYT